VINLDDFNIAVTQNFIENIYINYACEIQYFQYGKYFLSDWIKCIAKSIIHLEDRDVLRQIEEKLKELQSMFKFFKLYKISLVFRHKKVYF
jgi:hypothetical protein